MGIIPKRLQDQLDFFDSHAPTWVTNAVAIGITVARATAFQEMADDARTAFVEKINADDAARAATIKQNDNVRAARVEAADIIKAIKAFAEATGNPNAVYELAQIPPPAQPAPAPPPGQPTNLTVALESTLGDLTLRWKCSNPPGTSGTSYIVRRRIPGGAWEFVGVTGSKTFIDSTFEAGPDVVEYTVQAQRADSAGPISAVFTVNFGRNGPGLTIASVTSGKLAA